MDGLFGWPRGQGGAPDLQVTDGSTIVQRVRKIVVAGAVVSAPAPLSAAAAAGEVDITITPASSLPTDFISGLEFSWSSGGVFIVGTGSAYVPSASGLVTLTSAVSSTPTLAANTLYYVYLSSTGTISISTTAPSANYQGTAWKDSSSDRYIGSFLSSAGSALPGFTHTGSLFFSGCNVAAAPAVVLSSGSATTPTAVSCSGVVPPTAKAAIVQIVMPSGPTVFFAVASTLCSTTFGQQEKYTGGAGLHIMPLNSSQQFFYCCAAAGGQVTVSVIGYIEER